MSEYWHNKLPIPSNKKEQILKYVHGEEVGKICLKHEYTLLRVDGKTFRDVFTLNRSYLFRGDYTADPSENDYSQAENFLLENGLAGFSVTKEGWLVSLYSNLEETGFLKAAKDYIAADKLVCINSTSCRNGLVEAYKQLGFREVARTVNDTKLLGKAYGKKFIKEFEKYWSTPFHVFMIRGDTESVKIFNDYYDAYKFAELLSSETKNQQ